jgi:hypothetical protein
MGAVEDPHALARELDGPGLRYWKPEVEVGWYVGRIHRLEAQTGAEPRTKDSSPEDRPRIVASGDDVTERRRLVSEERDLRRKLAAERPASIELITRERDSPAASAERLEAIARLDEALAVAEAAEDGGAAEAHP